jgi:hypothetical protein
VAAGGELYGIEYPQPGPPLEAKLSDLRLRLEYGPLAGARVTCELPYRHWSGETGLLPPGGGGVGDAQVGLSVAVPTPAAAFALAATGRLTLPSGSRDRGTGEGRTVAQAGVATTLRIWRDATVPELRLHLSLARRWNPDGGRGPGGADALFVPWPPLYPAVSAGGGASDNDFLLLGAAVEFRRDNLSLFVEYTEARLPRASGAAVREFPRFVTPGLHLGSARGWGLSVAYDVNLSLDDPATGYVPAAPDLAFHAMLSRVFDLGGRAP